jgi:hypothetical protein
VISAEEPWEHGTADGNVPAEQEAGGSVAGTVEVPVDTALDWAHSTAVVVPHVEEREEVQTEVEEVAHTVGEESAQRAEPKFVERAGTDSQITVLLPPPDSNTSSLQVVSGPPVEEYFLDFPKSLDSAQEVSTVNNGHILK